MPRKTKDGWVASIKSESTFRTPKGNRTSGILIYNAPLEGLFLGYEGINNDVMFKLPDDPVVLRDLAAALVAFADEQDKPSN
jgi:hypothetical protein